MREASCELGRANHHRQACLNVLEEEFPDAGVILITFAKGDESCTWTDHFTSPAAVANALEIMAHQIREGAQRKAK